MILRPSFCLVTLFGLAGLAACSDGQGDQPYSSAALSKDPVLARALNDPLMTDPDLASRNQSNAVIAFHDSHPLPPIAADEVAASRAREAARLELLSGGQVASLPLPQSDGGSVSLAETNHAGDLVEAVGSRTDCVESMDASLLWSTQMPETSAVMPHGMVQQAAGVDTGQCVIRVVRYHTPVSVGEALEYHYTKASREGFAFEHFDAPESQIRGEWRNEQMVIHGRAGPRGLTEIDVIHWIK